MVRTASVGCVLVVAVVALLCCVDAKPVYVTVAYCPTDFTSAGAVISVESTTGNWSIVGKFNWPAGVFFGCPALYDPTYAYDPVSQNMYLDVIDDFGVTVTVHVPTAKVLGISKPGDPFFVGFTNMKYENPTKTLFGLSPTGTSDGLGAFQFGSQKPDSINGHYVNISNIPFRALMDDTDFLESSKNKFWAQASYDKRPENERCDPRDDTAQCLISIDTNTGALLSSKFTNFTVYKFARQPNPDGTILSFLYGFETKCHHPYEDFAFANVNLNTANATFVACMDKSVTIQEAEWVSDFSPDGSEWATANADGSLLQFISLNTTTGAKIAETDLDGLAKALGAAEGLVFMWGVDYS